MSAQPIGSNPDRRSQLPQEEFPPPWNQSAAVGFVVRFYRLPLRLCYAVAGGPGGEGVPNIVPNICNAYHNCPGSAGLVGAGHLWGKS